MKKLTMLGTIAGAALLTAVPFSIQWSQKNVGSQAAGGRLSLAELRWRMTNDAMPRARRGVDQ